MKYMQKIHYSTYVLESKQLFALERLVKHLRGVSGSKFRPEVKFDPSKVTQKSIFIQLIINILVFPRAPIPADHILLMVKL